MFCVARMACAMPLEGDLFNGPDGPLFFAKGYAAANAGHV